MSDSITDSSASEVQRFFGASLPSNFGAWRAPLTVSRMRKVGFESRRSQIEVPRAGRNYHECNGLWGMAPASLIRRASGRQFLAEKGKDFGREGRIWTRRS